MYVCMYVSSICSALCVKTGSNRSYGWWQLVIGGLCLL